MLTSLTLNVGRTAMMIAVCLLAGAAQGQTILYVDDDAAPGGNGLSWMTAFDDLQSALAIAQTGDEIRVAQGTYTPAPPNGPREATFVLVNGTTIRGGYAGIGASDPDANDPVKFETILSGDLNGNDGSNFSNSAEHVFNVITADGVTSATEIRGVVITGGNASFYEPGGSTDRRMYGGGLSGINGASPTLIDCVIRNNQSPLGGGGGIRSSSITLVRCVFLSNRTHIGSSAPGGALWISDGGHIEDCTFQNNSTGHRGGAIFGWFNGTKPILLKRCVFKENLANEAAGAFAGTGFIAIDCDFIANVAKNDGGACEATNSTFINCRFVSNAGSCGTGTSFGSAIGSVGRVEVVNCLFSGNRGSFGVFAVRQPTSALPNHIVNCTFVGNETPSCNGAAIFAGEGTIISNTVSWDNHFPTAPGEPNPTQASQIRAVPGTQIHNSCIQGWDGSLGGTGNHGNNPRFIDADGPDDIYGNADDNPRLLANSPLINRGDNAALPPDEFDLDGDGDTSEVIALDLDHLPRIVHGLVDIGAYEFQGAPCLADISGDGSVNVNDLLAVINAWGACVPGQMCNADLTLDNTVNVNDLLLVINGWGACP